MGVQRDDARKIPRAAGENADLRDDEPVECGEIRQATF
jgi:hypothetical protein